MDAEQQGSSSGFPLVSDRGKGQDWTEVKVGPHVRVRPEPVYDPTDERFGHGDGSKGAVTISHGDQGNGSFAAFFHLDDGSEAVVTGRMPGMDEKSLWVGSTTVHVDQGTGQFEPWVDQDIPLDSENPKRWG
jgi:hypothetical protein